MIKLLILDLDGTLADTGLDITNAVNYAIEPFGVSRFSVGEIKAMVGSGITKLLHSLIPPEKINQEDNSRKHTEEETVNRFLEYYSKHLLDNTEAYPGVKDTLPKLQEYKKTVISNKREGFSREILAGIGILGHFDTVLGSDSVKEKKPSPVPILEAMRIFRVSKSEAVIIGDSNYDIEAGKAAGIKTVAVSYGFRSREALEGADYIIDHFSELLNTLSAITDSKDAKT